MSKKPATRRYKLTLEYDGKNFSGWQKQKDARTVQGDLLKGAARVFGGDAVIDIQGCGRTDAGVHALEYVAHLQVASNLESRVVEQMLNEILPKDIAVIAAEKVDPQFHARHSCIARSYVYQLRSRKSAFGKRYSWWVREELDVPAMRKAAYLMEGMNDFAAYAEKRELKKSTKVLVHKVDVVEEQGGNPDTGCRVPFSLAHGASHGRCAGRGGLSSIDRRRHSIFFQGQCVRESIPSYCSGCRIVF
jgi:tRNA pseudouridine38-40 synthase